MKTRPHMLLAMSAMTLGLQTGYAQDTAAPQPANPLEVFEARVLEVPSGTPCPIDC